VAVRFSDDRPAPFENDHGAQLCGQTVRGSDALLLHLSGGNPQQSGCFAWVWGDHR